MVLKAKTNNLKKCTFILPVFNEEDRIETTLDYYIKELEINNEILIIDAFSKDKTKAIIKNYTKKYNFIKFTEKENNGTPETNNWISWLIKNYYSDYYIFLSCSERINKKTLELYFKSIDKKIDLIYVNRKSTLNNKNISSIYSNILDLILFRHTYMPLCRFASFKSLKKINTYIHDNWLSESYKVNTKHIKLSQYNIIHNKRDSFEKNSLKHLDYAIVESQNTKSILIPIAKLFREILYLIILSFTFRLNKSLIIELILRMNYHLQIIGVIIEDKNK